MNKNAASMSKTQRLTLLALLTAIVVVLQFLGGFIRLGTFSVSLVLVPIVIGAALLGVGSGAWLGFVFGIAVFASGDAAAFFSINAFGTIVTVLAKGAFAGLAAGAVYKALESKSKIAASVSAAIVCPIVNSGLFFLGCIVFFFDAIAEMSQGSGKDVFTFIILVLIGGNFLFELLFNLVLSPVILRIVEIGRRMTGRKHA